MTINPQKHEDRDKETRRFEDDRDPLPLPPALWCAASWEEPNPPTGRHAAYQGTLLAAGTA